MCLCLTVYCLVTAKFSMTKSDPQNSYWSINICWVKEICLISCKSTVEFLVECLLLSFWKIILFFLNRRVEPCWSFLVFLPFFLEHCFYILSVFCLNELLLFYKPWHSVSSVQWLSHFRLFATPWTAACQASLSITNSWSLLKLMSIELVMPSNHLILCSPLL